MVRTKPRRTQFPSSPRLRRESAISPRPWREGAGGEGDESLTVPPDFDPPRADLPPIREVQYNICLRAGLIEYLQEHKDPALAFFEKAKLLEPKRDFVVVKGEIPTGTERLASLAKSDPWLTPDAVRNGDQKAKLILMLADLYCEGEQHGKAIELCDRLIGGAAPRSSRDQISYAYFRRARGHYLIAGSAADPDAALADYVAAVGASPKAEWADSAIFFAANIEWNYKHNLEAAVSDWSRLLREHPKSKEADRCALYIGAAYFYSEQYAVLGLAAFESDREVIEEAADRQMAHLRTFQLGQFAALSQELLNEVSAAKGCLLSPTKKPIYDARSPTPANASNRLATAVPPLLLYREAAGNADCQSGFCLRRCRPNDVEFVGCGSSDRLRRRFRIDNSATVVAQSMSVPLRAAARFGAVPDRFSPHHCPPLPVHCPFLRRIDP